MSFSKIYNSKQRCLVLSLELLPCPYYALPDNTPYWMVVNSTPSPFHRSMRELGSTIDHLRYFLYVCLAQQLLNLAESNLPKERRGGRLQS